MLFFIYFLFPGLLLAQKSSFVGYYNTVDNVDSKTHVYLSIDSFKIITLKLLQNNNNMSVDIKTGIWKLHGKGAFGKKNATFIFNDSVVKEISIYQTTATFDDGSSIDDFTHLKIDSTYLVSDIFTNTRFRAYLKNKMTNF